MAFTLEQIIELAEELRAAGFDASARQCVAAEDLMIALAARGAAPRDPRGWRTLLAPIFCATPAEQEQFYLRFDLWLRRQPGWIPIDADMKAAVVDAPRRRQWLRRPAMVAVIGSIVLLAAGAWYLSRQTGYMLSGQITSAADGKPVAGARIEFLDGQTLSSADGKFALAYQTSNFHRLFRAGRQAGLRVAHADHEPHAASLPVHRPSPQTITLSRLRARAPLGSSTITLPKVEPAPTPTPPASSDSSRLRLWLAALPLLVFAVWLLRRWRRRRAMLRRLAVAGDPQLKSIKLKGAGDLLFQGQGFRRAAQALRRHREAASTDLDVDATVHWTLGRGGLFTPRYGARRTSPEYLLLVDRAGPGDEQARFGEEMARRLEAGGVYVDRYYFQNDPLTCRRFGDPLPAVLTLADLAARHPDHQLVVFGDGAGFVSPVTGEPERWLESLAAWPRRALLTPELASGYREQALAENDLLVLPATEEGLAALARSADEPAAQPNGRKPPRPFPRAILERPRRWLERHEPRPEAADELIRQLRDYLDDGGWLWLAACAVYPALSWEVTLYFGVELLGKTEDFAARLLALVRLPWFRHGAMPDWLRLRLIESFTPEQELAVRRAVQKMLSSLDDKGEIELEIAEPEAVAGTLERLKAKAASWRRRENLADLINNQPEESPLRDYVFLCFLSGQRPDRADRLAVSAPDLLRLAFFRDGHPNLGLRAAAAGAIALIVALLLSPLLGPDDWPYYLAALVVAGLLLRVLWPRRKKPPVETAPRGVVDLGNGVTLETIDLPGGEFTMGGERYDDEKPPHRVRVSPFAIGKYQVTQAQWKAVMGENPSRFKGDDLPVESVSWEDVNEFIKRLNQKTGMQFRLPTEAEWEYAARADTTTEYSFGDDEKQLGDYAWFSENSGNQTHPVGRKKPNRFGLFDMHGNVWEWCSDWYGDSYYAECQGRGTVVDPTGPGTGSDRVDRGGGWYNNAVDCRSANRNDDAPGNRDDNLGFRLVRVGP